VEAEIVRCGTVLETKQGDINAEERELSRIERETACTACGREFSEGDKKVARGRARDKIEVCRRETDNARIEYQSAQAVFDVLRPKFDRYTQLDFELTERIRRNERREWRREQLRTDIDRLRNEGCPYMVQIEDLHLKIGVECLDLEAIKRSMLEAEKAWTDYSTMVDFYSKKGIQSYIMENSFGFIQDKANYYLSILTGGSTQLEILPIKETKSGEKREEVHIKILRGGSETGYDNLSGGEKQRVSVALLFATNAFMRSQSGIDFLLLDEVLDLSLDETGQEALIELLREVARDISSILVISHKQFIKEHFDQNILVVKKNGKSRIVSGKS